MIQLREFIEHNDKKNIYKIGKTKQSNYSRYTGYPKGSIIMLHINCTDCDTAEKTIINIFKKKYIHKHQYGNEYFEGDYQSMIVDIINIISNNLINKTHEFIDSLNNMFKIYDRMSNDEQSNLIKNDLMRFLKLNQN